MTGTLVNMAFYDAIGDVIDEGRSESDGEWGDPPNLPLEPTVRIVSPDLDRRHTSGKRHSAPSPTKDDSGQLSSW